MSNTIRPYSLVLAIAVTAALGTAGCAMTPRQALIVHLSECARRNGLLDVPVCAYGLGYQPQIGNGSATNIYCRKQQAVAKGEALPQCFDLQKETQYVVERWRFMQERTITPPSNVSAQML